MGDPTTAFWGLAAVGQGFRILALGFVGFGAVAVVGVKTPSPDHGLTDLNTCSRALVKYIIGKYCNLFRRCTST